VRKGDTYIFYALGIVPKCVPNKHIQHMHLLTKLGLPATKWSRRATKKFEIWM